LRILVVEDEPANLKVLTFFLRDQGYEVEGARDGVEALQVDKSRFDLVLSDIRMPRMDGVTLVANLLSRVPVTPVFLMTADSFYTNNAVAQSGVPCISKPFSLVQLLLQMQNVLATRNHTSGSVQ
jgi:CheY-like chemotaxis protein